ncbi:hypothetical protein [Streptomyces sp. A0592]|uniref:hypothetical protein n=1 Tax=Streptomyces sp. A0592 TaxID=2563099 RepID=UPI00109E622D|nr:hypothetical protein [Streptomyces sp. A0592]THA74889.1 hypothetical protein E6U81_37380 [Streptomyces sp. A0592]
MPIGLTPMTLDLNGTDENGNQVTRFFFTRFDDVGNPVEDFFFDHLHGDDGPGVVASASFMGMVVLQSGVQGALSLLDLTDARLLTVIDEDAPPTIPQADWPVKLFLGGFVFAKWTVGFDVPVDSFDLDGRWARPPQP